MSVSILEALMNADSNLQRQHPIGISLAKRQLHNAVVLLEKGYLLDEQVEPLLEQYGSVEEVPDLPLQCGQP